MLKLLYTDGNYTNDRYSDLVQSETLRKQFPRLEETSISPFFFTLVCDQIKSVTLPGSIKIIYPYAFKNCENLEEVNLNDGLKTIMRYTFQNCNSLKKVVIPNTVDFIESAFQNLESLEEVIFEDSSDSNRTIDFQYDSFKSCPNLRKIDLGNLSNVNRGTFLDCENIKEISFYIGENLDEKYTYLFKPDCKYRNLQKNGEIIVITYEKNDKIYSSVINIKRKKIANYNYDLYLTEKKNVLRVFEFIDDISEDDLEQNQYLAICDESNNYYCSYSADEVRQIQSKINSFIGEIPTTGNQKAIYTRLVKTLAPKLEYDWIRTFCKIFLKQQVI